MIKKDLEYYRKNAEDSYMTTPISVLRYIGMLEEKIYNKVYCSICGEAHIVTTEESNDIQYTCTMCCDNHPNRCNNNYDKSKVLNYNS